MFSARSVSILHGVAYFFLRTVKFHCMDMPQFVSPFMQVVLVVKNPPANAGNKRHGFDPWVRKSPGGGHGNPLQYSCLWRILVHRESRGQRSLVDYSLWGCTESDTIDTT